MDTLFGNTAQRSRLHSHDRWTTLYQQTESFKTFGIAVEPPYVSMDEIPDLAELNTEENVIAKQDLLKFCNNLLRSRHQALYEHIEHLDKVTADQILAEVRNIHYQFLKQAIENIEQIKKEFEENAAYEALRDGEESTVKPYLLGVAVNNARFRVQGQPVNVKELKIQMDPDQPVTADQYFDAMNRIIAAGLFNSQLSKVVQEKIHRFEILMTGENHCLSRRFTKPARPRNDGMIEIF